MTTLQQLSSAQVSPEVPINENFETLGGLGVFGRRQPTTTGLTWGYYGGIYAGFTVGNGTLALTNAATNYIVVNRSTGVSTAATSTTNWDDDTNYCRLYKVTTAGSVITAVEDHRVGGKGLFR